MKVKQLKKTIDAIIEMTPLISSLEAMKIDKKGYDHLLAKRKEKLSEYAKQAKLMPDRRAAIEWFTIMAKGIKYEN